MLTRRVHAKACGSSDRLVNGSQPSQLPRHACLLAVGDTLNGMPRDSPIRRHHDRKETLHALD